MSSLIEQNINYIDLSFKAGDDFAFDLVSPFSLTGATIEATIGSINFTVSTTDPTHITLSLTELQTVTLPNKAPWKLRITQDGYTRTYFAGVYLPL